MTDTKAVFEKMGECVFAKDWDTLATLATDDCMIVGADGVEVPFMDNWKGIYEKLPKIRWINTYSLVTDTKLIFRCYDYAENKDGVAAMFYADGVVTFNEEGKISHYEWFLNPEQAATFAKLME